MTDREILGAYPNLENEDVRQAMLFATEAVRAANCRYPMSEISYRQYSVAGFGKNADRRWA